MSQFAGGAERLSNRTLDRYATSLAGLFKWAKGQGYVAGDNPFTERPRPKAKEGAVGWCPSPLRN
jgi:hypothetical protein